MAGEVDINVKADSKQAERSFKDLEKALKDLTDVLSELNKDTDDAEDGLDDTGDAAKKASKGLGDAAKYADKLNSSLGTIKDVAAGILAASGISNLADGIKDAAEQAFTSSLQMERSAIALERSYAGSSDEIIEWANNHAKAFGLTTEAATTYSAAMQGVLRNIGIADAGVASTISKNITAFAGDLSSLKGIESEAAFEATRDFLITGGGALEDFGIMIDDATVGAWAMTKGITNSFEELDKQSQLLIRYNYLLEHTSEIQGAFSSSLNTQAGTLASLEIAWSDFITQLGTYATPILIPIMNGLLTIVAYARAVLDALADIYGWELGIETAANNVPQLASNTSDITSNFNSAETATKETEGNVKDINKAISQGKKLLDLYTLDFTQVADTTGAISDNLSDTQAPNLIMPELADYQSKFSGFNFDIDIDKDKVDKVVSGIMRVAGALGILKDIASNVLDAFAKDPVGTINSLVSALAAYQALKFSAMASGSTTLASGLRVLAGSIIALEGGKQFSDFWQSLDTGDVDFGKLTLSIGEFAAATGLLVSTLGPGGALVSAVAFAIGTVKDGVTDMLNTSKELAQNATELARGSISDKDLKLVEEILPLYNKLENLLTAQKLGTVEVDQSEIDALQDQIIAMSVELDVNKGDIQAARNEVTEGLEKGLTYSVASNLFTGNVDWGKLRGFDVISAIFGAGEVYPDIGGDPIKNLIRNLNALEEQAKKTGKPLTELASGYFDKIMGSEGAFKAAAQAFKIDANTLESLRKDLQSGYSELSNLDAETQLLLAQFGTYYIAADKDVQSGTTGVAGLDQAVKEWIDRVTKMGYKVEKLPNGHLTVSIPFDSHLVGSLDAEIDTAKAEAKFIEAVEYVQRKGNRRASLDTAVAKQDKAYNEVLKNVKNPDYKGFAFLNSGAKQELVNQASKDGQDVAGGYTDGMNSELYNPEKAGQLYDNSVALLDGITNDKEANERGKKVATALVTGLDAGLTEAINTQGGIMLKLNTLSEAMNSVPDEFREHFKIAIKDVNSGINTMQFAFNLMNSASKGNPLAQGIKMAGGIFSSLLSGGFKNPTNTISSFVGGTSQPQQSIQSTPSRGNQAPSQYVNLNATIYIGDREINDYIIDVVTNNDNAVG